MNSVVIVFPGSNCDKDVYNSINEVTGKKPKLIWYKDEIPRNSDLIILPGGFSFGDYLRCGAIASKSSILHQIKDFIKKNTPILGICNGFQILIEAGFLPGMLLMNKSLKFICKSVNLVVSNNNTRFTKNFKHNEIVSMPVAHKVGNYFIPKKGLEKLILNDQILFRYSDIEGSYNEDNNPNGSINNIAGIMNEKGNVLGMMPHPERVYGNNKDLNMKKIIMSLCNEK